MSSGGTRIIITTRERPISDDINRLEQFAHADLAEILRRWVLMTTSDAGGAESAPAGVGTPLAMMVIGGFLCQPEVAGQSVTVAAGVAIVNRPDSPVVPGDSQAKFVNDDGEQTLGILTLTANAGGGRRIDVLECALVNEGVATTTGEVVTESDSRDIYNPATGTFTPAFVPKVAQVQFQYRIRLGTAGAGFPGTVAGWRPLMVASVPVGALTWDDVTCWDVRPLMSDLAIPTAEDVDLPVRTGKLYVGPTPGAAISPVTRKIIGWVTSTFGKWKVGGKISIDIANPTVASGLNKYVPATFPNTLDNYAYFYAVMPAGLPRWMEYSDPAGGRKPNGFRGIPFLTHIEPSDQRGYLGTATAAPAANGLLTYAVNTGMALLPLVQTNFVDGAPAHVGCATMDGNFVSAARSAGSGFASAVNDVGSLFINAHTRFDLYNTEAPIIATGFQAEVRTTLASAAGNMQAIVPLNFTNPGVYGGTLENNFQVAGFWGAKIPVAGQCGQVAFPLLTTYPATVGVRRVFVDTGIVGPTAAFTATMKTLGFWI